MNKFFIYLIFSLCLIFTACLKESFPRLTKDTPTTLPPITQTGENTFGCKVNGDLFYPTDLLLKSALSCRYSNGDLNLFCTGPGDCYITIAHNSLYSAGQYKLSGLAFVGPIKAKYNCRDGDNFSIDTFNTGNLIITRLDTVNKIVSGTFYFNPVNAKQEVVHIYDGRFDCKY